MAITRITTNNQTRDRWLRGSSQKREKRINEWTSNSFSPIKIQSRFGEHLNEPVAKPKLLSSIINCYVNEFRKWKIVSSKGITEAGLRLVRFFPHLDLLYPITLLPYNPITIRSGHRSNSKFYRTTSRLGQPRSIRAISDKKTCSAHPTGKHDSPLYRRKIQPKTSEFNWRL